MRRGPGLVGTVARTAVVAGTATVVAKGVGGAMDSHAQQQQQQAEADAAAMQAQSDVAELQQQMAAMQAQQAQAAMQAQQVPPAPAPAPAPAAAPAAAAAGPDLLSQMQQLAQLKDAGMLTDEEFALAKARLLGT
jgi:hypothetical protein